MTFFCFCTPTSDYCKLIGLELVLWSIFCYCPIGYLTPFVIVVKSAFVKMSKHDLLGNNVL